MVESFDELSVFGCVEERDCHCGEQEVRHNFYESIPPDEKPGAATVAPIVINTV
jgi:hypothetical protein